MASIDTNVMTNDRQTSFDDRKINSLFDSCTAINSISKPLTQQFSQRIKNRSNSRYKKISTMNTKFEKFLDLVFKSTMPTFDVKDEIVKYVQAIETSYMDAINDLKILIDKEKDTKRKVVAFHSGEVSQRNELESLFVECIEEVRKEIMKRRLKNEIINRKKF